jgi:S-adenosylmethionine synthetase
VAKNVVAAGLADECLLQLAYCIGLALSGDQNTTLAVIATINGPLSRAYLLNEQLREIFQAQGAHGRALLAGWLSWARRCRIPEFINSP